MNVVIQVKLRLFTLIAMQLSIAFGQISASSPKALNYINQYSEIAVAEMRRTGIPASIKLAQGLLESQCGESDLAKLANNHFGIKCSNSWMGEMYFKEDDEFDQDGNLVSSCFRVFSSAEESYIAHSDFLMDPKKKFRYGSLFKLSTTDYKSWAYSLKEAGYATDPNYPEKLINIIEKNALYKYDELIINIEPPVTDAQTLIVSSNESINTANDSSYLATGDSYTVPQRKSRLKTYPDEPTGKRVKVSRKNYKIEIINNLESVRAVGGETLKDLARAMRIKAEDVITYNDQIYHEFDILPQGIPIFLEKKNRNYYGSEEFHVVQDGQNMAYISQLYGVRLKNLYQRNRMKKDEEPAKGEKIYLKKTVEESHKPKTIKTRKYSNAEEFLWVKGS